MASSVVSAALFAAAVAASVVSAGCPSNIPNFEANIVQVFNGNREDYKWMFGLTTPTDAAPAGFSPCGETAYISQYDINSKGCASAIPNKVSAEPSGDTSCLLTYKDAIRQATVDLTCDETASAPRMNGEVTVQQVANEYHYAFKGAFSGVCGGGDDGDGGGDKKSGGCGGGCVFVILFFVGAVLYVAGTVAFNYFKLGKRGKELAPHPEFWLLIPGLIKDGGIFTFQLITKPCRKDGGGSTYTQV